MILTLFRSLWRPATGGREAPLNNASAAPRGSLHEKKQKQLEEEAALQQRRRDEEQVQKKEREEDSDFLWMWLLSEESRRAHQELMADLHDAVTAVRLACEDARAKELSARTALEELQRNAIVLPDGRRFYFTLDGTRLYGEDDQEITDERIVRDAVQQALTKPDAPSYEEFVERRTIRDQATENAQRQTEAIMDSLPAEVRDRYERLRESRNGTEPAYRSADPAFESFSVMHADFQKAVAAPLKEKVAEADNKPASTPAYKAAPPF